MNREFERPHAVLVNELGGNFGHIGPLLSIAAALERAGYRVSIVLPSLKYEALLASHNRTFATIQAPTGYFEQARANRAPVSYAEVLLVCGYTQIERLAIGLKAWRDLLRTLRPALLLFDFAPTAHLASAGLGCQTVLYGNGYCVPPRTQPLPAMPLSKPVGRDQIERSHAQLLDSIERAHQRLGIPSPASAALFASDRQWIKGRPELDVYQTERQTETYIGAFNTSLGGQPPQWPGGTHKRVLAYLQTHFPFTDALIAWLSKHFAANVFVNGAGAQQRLRLSTDTCFVSNRPFDIDRGIRESDWVICHAGVTTVCQAMVQRKPLLLFPLHSDQKLVSDSVRRLGIGHNMPPVDTFDDFGLDPTALERDRLQFVERYEKVALDVCDLDELIADL